MTETNSCFTGRRCHSCPVSSVKIYQQDLAATVVKTAINDPINADLSEAAPKRLVGAAHEAIDRVQGTTIPLGVVAGALALVAAGECHQEPYNSENHKF